MSNVVLSGQIGKDAVTWDHILPSSVSLEADMSWKGTCFYLAVCCLLILSCPVAGQTPSSERFEGILNVVWGDPYPGAGGGETRYSLSLSDGTNIPLKFTGQENVAISYFGKSVVVSGHAASSQMALPYAQGSQAFIVEDISLTSGPQAYPGPSASVFGTKKVIFLLLKFSDDTDVPHPPSFYTDMTNPDTPPTGEPFPATINGFYKKTSWNQFSWVGDVGGQGGIGAPGGWLVLPNPKSYYANCGWGSSCFSTSTLSSDGMALGRAQGISFANYDNINFVVSNDLDCCAWGGSYYSSVEGKLFGATWEPPWGQETGTYTHEMGHSLGLPHSGWVYYAYDSPWDMMSMTMSASTTTCASYYSRNSSSTRSVTCTEPGDGYIAPHQDFLGWIPSGNIVTTDTGSKSTIMLEPNTLPLGTTAKMLKICIAGTSCSGSTAHYFTVEARVKGQGTTSQYDNGLPGEGIVIHEFQQDRPAVSGSCFFNNQSGWAWPVDSTPGDYDSVNCNSGGRSYPNYALYNAQWKVGQTYTNSTYNFRVRVLRRSGSTFVVSVNPMPSSSDVDGDGKADVAVWRPSNGLWFILPSGSPGTYLVQQWGQLQDILVPGDYDGDGNADVAVWRPSNGVWFILPSGS
ncbi:MAG TPA: FG-GAP-like repeat-containing protein, partial [Acidobacteriota bacterium]|nr:FG-GAP-like repeat-containing protein [Acidobacteriota bacterium]